MKSTIHNCMIILIFILFVSASRSYSTCSLAQSEVSIEDAQQSRGGQNFDWSVSFGDGVAFIENKGQFDGRNWQKDSKIEYGVDYNSSQIFFTKKGLTYRFDKIIKNPNYKPENADISNRTNSSELVHISWVGANENPEIVSEEMVENYYSYAIKDNKTKEIRNINKINGYRKLIYKNLYDRIDIEYVLHPESGIKYSIIARPGADISKVRMKYSGGHTVTGGEEIDIKLDDSEGLKISTSLAHVTEHHPYTFYQSSKKEIGSGFMFEGNILSFKLAAYSSTEEIVIDPWVDSPNFQTSTAAWEVESDGSGNVYCIGGETPMQLKKYNSTGALQWTYTTPWDTSTVWLGTLATDNAGISYITSGVSPEIERIDTDGNMVWHNTGYNGSCEYWSITFNCDKTRLIVGGTYVPAIISFDFYSAIYEIDISNGNVLGYVTFDMVNIGGFMVFPIEVRSISSSKNAQYVYLTHNNVGAINQNIGACPSDVPVFELDNGHNLGYKCENYLPSSQNGGGLKALVANDQFFYTHSGNKIYQRLLSDGSLVTSVNLAGGSSSTVPITGGTVVENSGLAVDDCGNVYAGSGDRVVKFDPDLNVISQAVVPFFVYDVSVNSNGEILAVGAQSDNSAVNRNGKIQSVAMGACAQFALVCCDANICPVDSICDTDPAFNLSVTTPGGTFSGSGITNASTGTFNPSVAGPGTHTITYTLTCGSATTTIVVNQCATLVVCQEFDGSLTVSGGASPYTWKSQSQTLDCSECFFGNCAPPICNGTLVTVWTTYSTSANAAPPGTYPIQVIDNAGNTLLINSLSGIPSCSSCPTITITTSGVVQVACAGQSTGSFTTTSSGGASPYDYSLVNSGGMGFGTFNNVAGTQIFSNLPAGVYTLTVFDNNGCSGTKTITITAPTAIALTVTKNDPTCGGSDGSIIITASGGTPPYQYSINNGSNFSPTSTFMNLGSGTYSIVVTDAACSTTTQTTLNNLNGPVINDAGLALVAASCSSTNGSATGLTVSGGTPTLIYIWENAVGTVVSNSLDLSNVASDTYYLTVSDQNNCNVGYTVTITNNATPVAIDLGNDISICAGGTAILDAGAGYNGYNWSTGATTQSITISAVATYSVTVTDNNGCTGSDQLNLTVNPSPTADAGSDQTICNGSSTTLVGLGGSSYSWSTGSSNASITVSPAVTTTYYLTVTSNGCTGVDTVIIIVGSVLNPTINAGAYSICSGQNTQLEATGGTIFSWSTGATSAIITVSPTSPTLYTVTVSDGAGCSGTEQIQIAVGDSITVVINPPTICLGETAILTTSGGSSYTWSTGETSQSIAVTPTVTTDYSITVSDSICEGSTVVTVEVNDVPIADAGADQAICMGDNTQLTASGGSSFQWNSGEQTASISVYPTSTTNYTVTVTENGCSAIDQILVVVNSVPVISLGSDITICAGSEVTISAQAGYSYQWNTGDTLQSISATPISTTSYTVTATSNECSSSDSMTVIVTDIPIADAGDDQGICFGETVSLVASGGTNYLWNTTSTSAQISVSPIISTIYFVSVSQNSCTSEDSVTITVSTAITAIITASSDTVCQSYSTNLTASGGLTYLWNTGATTQTITETPLTSTSYYVTVTNSGCSDSTDIIIIVNDSIIATSSPSEICYGDSAVLSVSSGTAYTWSTSETTQSIVVLPLSSTNYYVTASANGCSASTEVSVTVHSLPQVNAGEDQGICQGNTVTLSATGGTSYVWSNSMINSTIILTPFNSTTYFVTATTSYGCSASDQVVVSVYQRPLANAGLDKTLCEGDNTQLNASGGVRYLWSPSTGLSNDTIYNPLASPITTTSYALYVLNEYGCSNIDSITVYINPILFADVQVSVFPNGAVCSGEELTFIASGTNLGSDPTFQWKCNNLNVGANSPLYISSSITDDAIVTCILTSSEGCVKNNPAVDFVQVQIYAIPEVPILSVKYGCEPYQILFNSLTNSNYQYLWDFGDNTASSLANPEHTYSAGIYDVSVTVTSDEGCSNSLQYDKLISVFPKPETSFYPDPVITDLFDPTIVFFNSSSGGYIDVCYFGDSSTSSYSSGDNFEHTYINPGNYVVRLVTNTISGCTDSDSTYVVIQPVFTFYAPEAFLPNGKQDNAKFFVSGVGIDETDFHLYIYDRWGEIVFETDQYDSQNPATYGWDGKVKNKRFAPSGVYTWLAIYKEDGGKKRHEKSGSVVVIR